MQITREQVTTLVYAHLRERAEAIILANTPDLYYGWRPAKIDKDTGAIVRPAGWIGEEDERRARQAVRDANEQLRRATVAQQAARYYHDETPDEDAAVAAATGLLVHQERELTQVLDVVTKQIERYRERCIESLANKLFKRTYRRAMNLEWDVYHPAIDNDLRRYVKFWHKKKDQLTPSSVVFLYLIIEESITHAEQFGTTAISGENYLAKIPLVRAGLDVRAAEDEPSLADRQYVDAWQEQLRYAARPDAHENGDKRDSLADFVYDGLPEQLGALWLDKNDGHECPNCHEKITQRTVHNTKGYAIAEVCPNYKHKAGCTHRPLTPRFATKMQLRDHLCIEWALGSAA